MKILLTGILPDSVGEIATRLARSENHVAVLGQLDASWELPAGIVHHNVHPGHPDSLKLIEAARYEAVVFFFACQCEDTRAYGSVQGGMLDALFSMLNESSRCGVERFVLVTDQRVFGAAQSAAEAETPMPDTPTGVLIKAAEDCLFCGVPDGVKPLLIRVSSVYGTNDENSFFAFAARCARSKTPLVLNGTPDTPCDFLHADDLGALLDAALNASIAGVCHVRYGKPYTYGVAERALREALPGLTVSYTHSGGRSCVLTERSARALDWIPRHDFSKELDRLQLNTAGNVPKKGVKKQGTFTRLMRVLLPWVELVLLAALALALEQAAQHSAIVDTLDYMLLFVAIMGTVHGRRLGGAAALIACLRYAWNWTATGNALYLLLYNPDHWLPLSGYLLCGTLFGYMHDKLGAQITMLRREKEELKQQNEFLQTMYHQAYEDRNQLQEQVMRSRDSYGRIYRITRELDTLQPEQIFLSTLNVLEDTMQNQSVAIYECKPGIDFARLVVHSRSLKRLDRSMDMAKFSLMSEKLHAGKVFANISLAAGYPAYAAPVMHDNALHAILVLWDVPFGKQNQYYENLLSVVGGLVQSALVRALRYLTMSDDMYLPDTHILTDKAFRSALGVYQNIRKRRMGQYLLVRVNAESPFEPEEYDARIGKAVRSTDLVGRLSSGEYCVLFPQASADNLPQISMRFLAQDLTCEVLSQEVAYGG